MFRRNVRRLQPVTAQVAAVDRPLETAWHRSSGAATGAQLALIASLRQR